jgi:flagellar motor protein MotB
MRPVVVITTLAFLALPLLSGCRQGGMFYNPQAASQQQQQQQYLAQVREYQQRATNLDTNNNELHQQVALAQKQNGLLKEEITLLRKRLAETAGQLEQTRTAKQQADQQLQVLQASITQRGGATIRANSSLGQNLPTFTEPGVQARLDGDVVRVSIPADRLFYNGTAQLQQSSIAVLTSVGGTIARQYPGRKVGIEGHASSGGVAPAGQDPHFLTVSQAAAVYQQLVAQRIFTSDKLHVLGHGSNHPLVSNATAQGQAQNRRIELVVYPD